MARRAALLGLLLCVGTGAAIWKFTRDPCAAPVAYRLDRVDERFGVSREDVVVALREAEALWRRAAGRDLFVQRSTAPLVVNLVYDERQRATQGSARMRQSLDQTRDAHAQVGEAYAFSRRTWEGRRRDYQDASASYQQRVQAFNGRVQDWNSRGGAPPDVQARLESERAQLDEQRQQLEAQRAVLEELAAGVNRLADRGNALATSHQDGASTFNALYGAPRQFHQGEFDGREITVFEFYDPRDLVLVLAHELGHARGLGHVDDPTAIMHAVGNRQDLAAPQATPADVQELRRACGR